MSDIFEFLLSIFISHKIPEKKEYKSVKIFFTIVIILILFNIIYYKFIE
jgi:energy-coupling factor transporter transmembrane protein EcfT